jgi:hypothetical protein
MMGWRIVIGAALAIFSVLAAMASATAEQWDVFELTLNGPSHGNPFSDVELSARFTQGQRTLTAQGFYDGAGVYRIRFMPEATGEWRYETQSNRAELDRKSGTFTATPPRAKNHGPVRVHKTFHFAYADGTPFRQVGTTCYVWTHQTEALQEQTLKTLAASPFNKIRFCVFPKYYDWNRGEPSRYPFEGTPPNRWDFTRFNPEFFWHFEQRVRQLRALGIEADIILFHPYDEGHWGFDKMGRAADERYLRYVIARLGAERNVWWSLANEFDHLLESKPLAEWDRLFQLVQSLDPHQHLRSIHQNNVYYDHNQPWVTHASIQNAAAVLDYGRAMLLRDVYRKPVVFDEVKYEGNIAQRWGNLSGEDLVLRFWMGYVAGTYAGHGETFLSPDDVLWWSKGGVLKGQSSARLGFLRRIMEEGPADGLNPIDKWMDIGTAADPGRYYVLYFGKEPRRAWKFELFRTGLMDGMKFRVEVIDTWGMTITPVPEIFEAKRRDAYTFEDQQGREVALPGRPYIALRVRRIE